MLHQRIGYVVIYTELGEAKQSEIVSRFDSLNELSAKTIAKQKIEDGCSGVYICEVLPMYQVLESDGIENTTWKKLEEP